MDTLQIDLEFLAGRAAEPRAHRDPELLYVLQGEATVLVEGFPHRLFQKDFLVVNAGQRHACEVVDGGRVGTFHLSGDLIARQLRSDSYRIEVESVAKQGAHRFAELSVLLEDLFAKQGAAAEGLPLFQLYLRLLDTIVRKHAVAIRSEGESEKDERRIQEIKDYIHRNYASAISLKSLAASLFLSETYLSKYIKRHLGTNFLQYLNEVRYEHALTGLLHSDQSIAKVAQGVGFTNPRMFGRMVEERHGIPPAAYRREFRGGPRPEPPSPAGRGGAPNGSRPDDAAVPEPGTGVPRAAQPDPVHEALPAEPALIPTETVVVPPVPVGDLSEYWNRTICVGTADELLLSDVQEHVLKMHARLRVRSVRFVRLYTKTMYLDWHEIGMAYNFNRLDRILDFLLNHGIKPHIELANKPKVLSRLSRQVTRLQSPNETNLFSSRELAAYFFGRLAEHLDDRYGADEVREWIFEFWMTEEEDMFNRRIIEAESVRRHIEWFDLVAGTLREHLPGIRIGTGGFSTRYNRSYLAVLLGEAAKATQPPDFLSFYAFPYALSYYDDPSRGAPYGSDFVRKRTEEIRAILDRTALRGTPIWFTEWSMTPYVSNAINDSCVKASYVLKTLIDCAGTVDLLSAWVGSDLYGDFVESDAPLIGGPGLLTRDGIPKPAWFAYEFMNGLGRRIFDRGPHHLVTGDGHGGWCIVCHNHKKLNALFHIQPEERIDMLAIDDLLADARPLSLDFRLEAGSADAYRVRTLSVSQEHGSVQNEWVNMLRPKRLDREDVEHLQSVCVPDVRVQVVTPHHGRLAIHASLEPNEIQFLRISAHRT